MVGIDEAIQQWSVSHVGPMNRRWARWIGPYGTAGVPLHRHRVATGQMGDRVMAVGPDLSWAPPIYRPFVAFVLKVNRT